MADTSKKKQDVLEEKRVLDLYNCKDIPLQYEIKPRGTIEFVESDEIKKEDFLDD